VSVKSSNRQIEHSLVMPNDIHSSEKQVPILLSKDNIKFSYDSRRPEDGVISPVRIDESMASGE
jgi:hypothetical protein